MNQLVGQDIKCAKQQHISFGLPLNPLGSLRLAMQINSSNLGKKAIFFPDYVHQTMKLKWAILVFIAVSNVIFAQPGSRDITILDKSNNEPVPYATVLYLSGSGGTYSNEKGVFILRFPDSLQIRHISYHPEKFSPDELGDTLYLERRYYSLDDVKITSQRIKSNDFQLPGFSKKHKLHFNLPSFEIGVVVSYKNKQYNNILIPIEASEYNTTIRLNLYTVRNSIPDSLLYQEIQTVSTLDNKQFISFTSNTLNRFQSLDSVFISIELLATSVHSGISNNNHKGKGAMKLFFDFKKEYSTTLATRNFDKIKRWAPLESPDKTNAKPPNLIFFLK